MALENSYGKIQGGLIYAPVKYFTNFFHISLRQGASAIHVLKKKLVNYLPLVRVTSKLDFCLEMSIMIHKVLSLQIFG